MKLSQLLGHDVRVDADVQAIASDSRQLTPETWWLAARGQHCHALDYPHPDCAGVIFEPPYAGPIAPEWLPEPELATKMGLIAARFYDHPSRKLAVYGITGTDGKSSFVDLIAQLAPQNAMIGTIGIGPLAQLQKAQQTTPDPVCLQRTLAELQAQGIEKVALEVSSHALSQQRIAGVAFRIALFSNLSRDHLDYHRDLEDYFLAKAQLFARPNPWAVINLDDEHGRRLLDEALIHRETQVLGLSTQGRSHPRCVGILAAQNLETHPRGLSFELVTPSGCAPIHSALMGQFNVYNLLNVAACLHIEGQEVAAIAAALARLRGVPGRLECFELGAEKTALVDYAHTPNALANALQAVRAHVRGKLWVLFGCGGERDHGKRPLMAEVAERLADGVILSDDNPRHEDPESILAELRQGLRHPEKVQCLRPRAAAIHAALDALAPGDALLIAGKGHEDYQIIGDERQAYSDQAEIRAWQSAQR